MSRAVRAAAAGAARAVLVTVTACLLPATCAAPGWVVGRGGRLCGVLPIIVARVCPTAPSQSREQGCWRRARVYSVAAWPLLPTAGGTTAVGRRSSFVGCWAPSVRSSAASGAGWVSAHAEHAALAWALCYSASGRRTGARRIPHAVSPSGLRRGRD